MTVDVNIKALLLAPIGADTSIKSDLPPIEEIIEFEMSFVSASGIHVQEVKEVQETEIKLIQQYPCQKL